MAALRMYAFSISPLAESIRTHKLPGSLHSLTPRTYQTNSTRYTLHLPTNIFVYALHRPDIHEVKSHIPCSRTFRRPFGLDDSAEKCSSSLDRQHPQIITSYKHQDGNRSTSTCLCFLHSVLTNARVSPIGVTPSFPAAAS